MVVWAVFRQLVGFLAREEVEKIPILTIEFGFRVGDRLFS
jgi:hypothetical protein